MRILMLCGMIMLSSIVQARPNQQVPQLNTTSINLLSHYGKEVEHQESSIAFFLRSQKYA